MANEVAGSDSAGGDVSEALRHMASDMESVARGFADMANSLSDFLERVKLSLELDQLDLSKDEEGSDE